jgi:NAD(P)-dependent dehydrogenase (short-subunit alcohol dehydrogenase family)
MGAADLFRLDGRVAIVTGACGKLGPIWTETLLDAGAAVAALDLERASAPPPLARLLEERGEARVRLYRADVRSRAELAASLERMIADLGTPEVLVNNAGIDQPPGTQAPFLLEDIPAERFRDVLEVNLVGAFQAMQVFGGAMARAGRGSIVNIGSLYATVSPDARLYDHIQQDPPFLKPPAYGASKAGLLNLTRFFATHWGPHGVRVNGLSPGGVLGGQDEEFKRKFTSRVPLGRMAEARDLRGPLLFLASDASAYVTGENLKVDGGFTAW